MLLTVDKIVKEDLPARVKWINDPRVNQYMYFQLPVSLQGTIKWYEKVNRNYDRFDLVFKNEAGVPVGMSGITSINTAFRNGEFYIFINPDMQGKGVGKAITAWMLDYGFLALDLSKIYLYVDGSNQRAVELYEKIGFVKEGHLRQHRMKNGKYHDKLVFGMLRSEWLSEHRFTPVKSLCTVLTTVNNLMSA